TMGDIPLVMPSTFDNLLKALRENHMAVLGFRPANKKDYGLFEIDKGDIKRIIESKHWSRFSKERKEMLEICNSGIYAFRKNELMRYLDILGRKPHTVLKERHGKITEVEEFFITDLVELMNKDGLKVGYAVSEDEDEVMGVDDLQSLIKAQEIFSRSI
ncbi:MobA-like NTP transferase domain containing protein, partial [Thermodesulfobacteriota bacterium]